MPAKKNVLNHIDKLIGQAQKSTEKDLLDKRLNQNLAFFKHKNPKIHKLFKNYQPTDLSVVIDNHDSINLLNQKNQVSVYPDEAKTYAIKQVNLYLDNPIFLRFKQQPNRSDIFFQNVYEGQIKKQYLEQINQFSGDLSLPVGLCLLSGCGLGYHLSELIEKLDIYHLVIIEDNMDSFYASMHTVDWQMIYAHFEDESRSIHILIDKQPLEVLGYVRALLTHFGLHHAINAIYYQHLTTVRSSHFTRFLEGNYSFVLNGYGFLEDEQIGLAHSVENLKQKIPVMNSSEPLSDLPDVFIVGNGPSLDNLIETIKKYQSNSIVMSCGTAIGSLMKAGIKPDIHIEMERTGLAYDIIQELTDKNYTKDIILMALNTIPPETFAGFKLGYMAVKSNDAGVQVINDVYQKEMPELEYVNPTCTNAGLAFALALGFRNIFLIGVDLGMKDDKQHHASMSQYFDNSSPILTNFNVEKTSIEVKGNFSETVKTTTTLNMSRNNMTLAINKYQDAKVYNLNDGAYIESTIPLSKNKIEKAYSARVLEDKTSLLIKICSQHFELPPKSFDLDARLIENKYTNDAVLFLENCLIDKPYESLSMLYEDLNQLVAKLVPLKSKSIVSWYLVSGSVLTFCQLTYYVCIVAKNHRELELENYNRVRDVFKCFLNDSLFLLKNNLITTHKALEEYNAS